MSSTEPTVPSTVLKERYLQLIGEQRQAGQELEALQHTLQDNAYDDNEEESLHVRFQDPEKTTTQFIDSVCDSRKVASTCDAARPKKRLTDAHEGIGETTHPTQSSTEAVPLNKMAQIIREDRLVSDDRFE